MTGTSGQRSIWNCVQTDTKDTHASRSLHLHCLREPRSGIGGAILGTRSGLLTILAAGRDNTG